MSETNEVVNTTEPQAIDSVKTKRNTPTGGMKRYKPSEFVLDHSRNFSRAFEHSKEAIDEMMDSISRMGILHAVEFHIEDGKMILDQGFRRVEAAQRLEAQGLKELRVPAIERNGNEQDRSLRNLEENINSKQLSPIDKAIVMTRLTDHGMSRKMISEHLKMNESAVSFHLTVYNNLPMPLVREVHDGRLKFVAALKLAQLNPQDRNKVLAEATDEDGKVKLANIRKALRRQGKTEGRSLKDLKHFLKSFEANPKTEKFDSYAQLHLDYLSGVIDEVEVMESLSVLFEEGTKGAKA